MAIKYLQGLHKALNCLLGPYEVLASATLAYILRIAQGFSIRTYLKGLFIRGWGGGVFLISSPLCNFIGISGYVKLFGVQNIVGMQQPVFA